MRYFLKKTLPKTPSIVTYNYLLFCIKICNIVIYQIVHNYINNIL